MNDTNCTEYLSIEMFVTLIFKQVLLVALTLTIAEAISRVPPPKKTDNISLNLQALFPEQHLIFP